MAQTAAEAGVTYCIEALAPPESNFITTVDEAAAVVRSIDSPAVKTMIDCSAAGRSETRAIPDLLRQWLPTKPGTPTLTDVTDNTATMSWAASSDNVAVTGYRIFRDGLLVGQVHGRSGRDRGLAPGTSYRFAVAAVDTQGYQSASARIARRPPRLERKSPKLKACSMQ